MSKTINKYYYVSYLPLQSSKEEHLTIFASDSGMAKIKAKEELDRRLGKNKFDIGDIEKGGEMELEDFQLIL